MNDNDSISITVAWRLPGRKGQDGGITVPHGSRVADLPALLGEDARGEHVLFVRNQRMCDGTEELEAGDRIVILPVLEGG